MNAKRLANRMLFLILVLAIAVPATALAATYLPHGATITATVSGDTATITVTGISGASVERYYWERIDKSPGMTMDLKQGRRFQVMSGGKYLLITPEMASGGPYKLIGVGIDCSNEKGCCLIVK
ncbi:MAG: hypothetical protein Q8L09_03690 [Candidatus Moranbacteria bacterium]|nr:hypothetical protein [Candidatus Moranbacteria bacterium]